MAKSEGQKLKLLYILKLLSERTDEEHAISTPEIIKALEGEEICVERKTVYADIQALQEFGYDILVSKKRGNSGYYMASREFELAELKLLVDAVQSSKFVTAKKSKELIGKLEKLSSQHEAKQLQRQVYVSDRNKNSNESIYYSVDDIHKAMQDNKMIRFRYYDWGADKQMHFRKDGAFYEVSPYFLVWKDENYYLVAFDENDAIMKHYRVDKMSALSVVKRDREGMEEAKKINPAIYTQQNFGMFAGQEQMITLQFPEKQIGIIIDRFGKEVDIRNRGEGICSARVKVAVSNQFFGWLTGLGGQIRILKPDAVAENYCDYLSEILQAYRKEGKI
ncbi:MAG: WYL domain-containing transcriptional regulator [Lachnospiraceae bacterium]|nr:WYL domain-containing transcriptional regulator [Lachnospiraceae bacterium]